MRKIHITCTIILLVVSYYSTLATHLPPEWCTMLATLCKNFNDTQPTHPVVNHIDWCSTMETPIMFLFPAVIMWSPLEQFRHWLNINIKCPKCSQNNTHLYPIGWRNGASGKISEPRKS